MSTSIDESNARWKQNLLANASEIWKQKISIFDWVYGQSSKNKDDTHLKTIENEHKKKKKKKMMRKNFFTLNNLEDKLYQKLMILIHQLLHFQT